MRNSDDVRVFEEIYRSYAGDVFRFLLYLSGDYAISQDLAQETFVRAWTAKSPVQTATAKAYLLSIARNLYVSDRRKHKPGRAEPETLATSASQEESLEHRVELARALSDLALLADGDRAAFVMAVIEEMSHEEVGRALGIGVGAVKARVFRARMRLGELRTERNMKEKRT